MPSIEMKFAERCKVRRLSLMPQEEKDMPPCLVLHLLRVSVFWHHERIE